MEEGETLKSGGATLFTCLDMLELANEKDKPLFYQFWQQVGLKPDTRVLISRIKTPESGGQVEIAPDALGRARRLVFLSWGTEERAIDIDVQAPPKGWRTGRKPTSPTWAAVEAVAAKLKSSTIPIYYDGPADQVSEYALAADDDEMVLWRPWREGPWRPLHGAKNVEIKNPEGFQDNPEAEGGGDVGGGGGDEPDGDGGPGPGQVDEPERGA